MQVPSIHLPFRKTVSAIVSLKIPQIDLQIPLINLNRYQIRDKSYQRDYQFQRGQIVHLYPLRSKFLVKLRENVNKSLKKSNPSKNTIRNRKMLNLEHSKL